MNCTKCGKELTDKRRKICAECAEKEKKEKEEMKAKKAAEKKEKEVAENTKETKSDNKSKKNEDTKTKLIALGFAVAIILVICLIVGLVLTKGGVGNTIGNIRNYGYSTTDGKYIYYLAPNEDSTAVGIFKIRKNGKGDPEKLFMEDLDVVSINVYNGYLYFIGVSPDKYSDEDEINNKIYKMKTNGKQLTVINDNEFNNDCYEIYAVNGHIYYIGTDNNIYKMSLNGTDRTLVSENATGYLGVTDKYIIYNAETSGAEDYTTYIMDLDGSNQRPIIEGQRLYSVNIEKNYVYYTNIDKQICRTKIDSGEEELLVDTTAYNMNLKDNYIYFLNYKDVENGDYTVCLYKVKNDGSEKEATSIKELDTYSSFINVVGDWVVYMDSNETEGFINLVKTDGSDTVCVYLLDYTEYYSTVPDTTTSSSDPNAPEVVPDTTDPANTEVPDTTTDNAEGTQVAQ